MSVKTKAIIAMPFAQKDVAKSDLYCIGAGVDLEWQTTGLHDWEIDARFPFVGLSIKAINWGFSTKQGQIVAAYPYVGWNLYRSDAFRLALRGGMGVGAFTRTMHTTPANSNVSSHATALVSGALSAQFNIDSWNSIDVGVEISSYNNMQFKLPNYSILVPELSIAYIYRPNGLPSRNSLRYINPLPMRHTLDIYGAASAVDYYFADSHRVLTASLHVGYLNRITNCYFTGVGIDAFYNGIFVAQGNGIAASSDKDRLTYAHYYIEQNKFGNHIRVGLSWNNLFRVGRVGIIADLGLYAYDPIADSAYSSNLVSSTSKSRYFYSFDPHSQDGWFYMRAGIRLRVLDNLYIQASVKSHLMLFECAEFGIGYNIPFVDSRRESRMHPLRQHSTIYHP